MDITTSEKLITCSKRLSRGKKIKLHDEGKPIRTWTHSEDTANAIQHFMKKQKGTVFIIYLLNLNKQI